MNDTKELILLTALRLFAKDGYEAVSVSTIAGELGMVKSSLYKHYRSKQDILDSIVRRMSELDYEKAKESQVPEGTYEEMPEAYEEAKIDNIKLFTEEMFLYWTEEEFPTLFRKMLTIEQYRNNEMKKLFGQYISSGPLSYVKNLLEHFTGDKENADVMAIQFYSPIYMLYSLCDSGEDEQVIKQMLCKHINQFIAEIKEKYKKN